MSVSQLGLHPQPEDLEGAAPVYGVGTTTNLHPPPVDIPLDFKHDGTRKAILREWGQKREQFMHRKPVWCMDQLVSGSGLYPPRYLTDEWFTDQELQMIKALEARLQETNHAQVLAKDMMALKLYEVDVRIIVDDSGSMSLSMFGARESREQGWDRRHIQKVFGKRAFSPDSLGMFENTGCRLQAGASRWSFLTDALSYWDPLFATMQVYPKYYAMNRIGVLNSSAEAIAQGPHGRTPSGETFLRVLQDIEAQDPHHKCPHLIICLTDGEANDADLFNRVLDSIQDGAYGDVQVLLMGLSLEPEDIRFFEDEECDDTRIRTIEAYEVEQQMILWRKVIERPTQYNFAMHSVRALVTNFFPADYDYEAPIQSLRHRLYITLHALDRRITGCRDNSYASVDMSNCCGLGALLGGGQRQRSTAGADAVESELEDILNDPRFDCLLEEMRPPPKRAERFRSWGNYRSSSGNSLSQVKALRNLQSAIGALQPSEWMNRDLQYSDTSANGYTVRRAVDFMCQAIGDPQLSQPVGSQPVRPQPVRPQTSISAPVEQNTVSLVPEPVSSPVVSNLQQQQRNAQARVARAVFVGCLSGLLMLACGTNFS